MERRLQLSPGSSVTYEAKANMNAKRGTVTFWAKRASPKPEGRYTFQLGGWTNADNTWVWLYRWEWFDTVNILHGKGGTGDIGLQLSGDGDDGQWHFFAFTWDAPGHVATWMGRRAGRRSARTSPCSNP